MEILKVTNAGFCFGVKRAINIAFKAARDEKEKVYTLGPIIHNPQVVEKLSMQGVMAVEDLNHDGIGTLIIRSHGASPDLFQKASQKGIKVIDATCPFVKKAQKYANLLKREGYQVVIVGDKGHPEVIGLLSYAGEGAFVVESVSHLEGVSLKSKVGVIVQTTERHSIFREVVLKCLEKTKEIKVHDTICDSTVRRQEATKSLAKEVDLMLVVGGRCSANTTQLAAICREWGAKTYHIEVPDEIEEKWFYGVDKVGVTGGASTPDWLINGVMKRLKEINKRFRKEISRG